MKALAALAALVLLAAGCREELTLPSDCPDFCPGGGLVVRDTVIDAIPAGDSTFYGYVGRNEALGMIATNGAGAGTAYAIVSFEARPDTLLVGGINYAYAIDSLALVLGLIARDTAVDGSQLMLYRLPPRTDSSASFADIEALLTPDRLLDSIAIPDSLERGELRLFLSGDSLPRLAIPAADSGRLSLGIKLQSPSPTGVRLGSRFNTSFGPGLITWVTTESEVVAEKQQRIETIAEYTGFVRDLPPLVDPDLLVVGGSPSGRSLVRFALPGYIADQGSILRATLELTPARPFFGLAHDPTVVEARAIVADLGYRSPPVSAGATAVTLPITGSDVVRIEVFDLVQFWRGGSPVPQALYLSLAPEGYSFGEPVFHSTRSATGRPRLRITYALPGRPEVP